MIRRLIGNVVPRAEAYIETTRVRWWRPWRRYMAWSRKRTLRRAEQELQDLMAAGPGVSRDVSAEMADFVRAALEGRERVSFSSWIFPYREGDLAKELENRGPAEIRDDEEPES